MASLAASSTAQALASRTSTALPVSPVVRPRAARVAHTVRASAQKENFVAPIVAATVVASSLVLPEVASASELTPSVKALLGSVVNGGIVVGLIAGAITVVSGFDPVNRGK